MAGGHDRNEAGPRRDQAVRPERTWSPTLVDEEELNPARDALARITRSNPAGMVSALHRAGSTLRSEFVAQLQREVGNSAVQRALPGATAPEAPAVEFQPYRSRRMRNDKLDEFEFNKNRFGPPIFEGYCRNRDRWAPLFRLVRQYWRNSGTEAGIQLQPEEIPAVWALLSDRISGGEMQTVRNNARGRGESAALLEAFWVEFQREYPRCYKQAQQLWLASTYRLDHEFFAVHFRMVQPPGRYWARP
jgi:hypothetical protein